MLRCHIFSQYEKSDSASQNELLNPLFLNEKIYLLYKT